MNYILKRHTIGSAHFCEDSYLERYQEHELWELEKKDDRNLFWFEKPLVTFLLKGVYQRCVEGLATFTDWPTVFVPREDQPRLDT